MISYTPFPGCLFTISCLLYLVLAPKLPCNGVPMQRTVSAHIEDLERMVRRLTDELMLEDNLQVRNELEAKVRAAEVALNHYRAALQLEQSLTHHQH